MKKLALGLAAAWLGFSALSGSANAMPAHRSGITASSDLVQAHYHHRHRKVCTVRTVVHRGYHGRRIVKRVRVCR